MEAKTETSRVGIDEWKMEARIQIDGHVFFACLDDCHIHMATEIVTNYTFWTEKVFGPWQNNNLEKPLFEVFCIKPTIWLYFYILFLLALQKSKCPITAFNSKPQKEEAALLMQQQQTSTKYLLSLHLLLFLRIYIPNKIASFLIQDHLLNFSHHSLILYWYLVETNSSD